MLNTFQLLDKYLLQHIASFLSTVVDLRCLASVSKHMRNSYATFDDGYKAILCRNMGKFATKYGFEGIDDLNSFLCRTGLVISGSFLLQCITGEEWPDSDIDFYMDATAKVRIQYIHNEMSTRGFDEQDCWEAYDCESVDMCWEYCNDEGKKVQIVLAKYNIADTISKFDFSFLSNLYWVDENDGVMETALVVYSSNAILSRASKYGALISLRIENYAYWIDRTLDQYYREGTLIFYEKDYADFTGTIMRSMRLLGTCLQRMEKYRGRGFIINTHDEIIVTTYRKRAETLRNLVCRGTRRRRKRKFVDQ